MNAKTTAAALALAAALAVAAPAQASVHPWAKPHTLHACAVPSSGLPGAVGFGNYAVRAVRAGKRTRCYTALRTAARFIADRAVEDTAWYDNGTDIAYHDRINGRAWWLVEIAEFTAPDGYTPGIDVAAWSGNQWVQFTYYDLGD